MEATPVKKEPNWKLILLLFIGIITILNIMRPAWIEPDAIGFYNRECKGGSDFNTPPASRLIFDQLKCEELTWKVFQGILMFAVFSSLYFGVTKILGYNERIVYMLGLSYFFTLFLLALEDDHLAFPIVIVASIYLLKANSWKARLGYILTLVFLTTFVWEGAYIVMGIILLSNVIPFLSLLPVIGGMAVGRIGLDFTNDYTELRSGLGFFTNNIIVWLMALGDYKKIVSPLWNRPLWTMVGLMGLSFVYPKFGVFTIIPLVFLLHQVFETKKITRLLSYAGLLSFMVISGGLLLSSEPGPEMMKMIQKGVDLQKEGKVVYNEWIIARQFRYLDGNPIEENGHSGQLVLPTNQPFYWIGRELPDCQTIETVEIVSLQECTP